jgi:integrase/recombinase XerD
MLCIGFAGKPVDNNGTKRVNLTHEGHEMAVHILDGGLASPLETLVADYLNNCRARGVSPRTDEQYSYALESVFLPWCAQQGITHVRQLDRRALDRFTSMLLQRPAARGGLLSKHSVHTYVRPVRLMLTWAGREGEDVVAKPQLPRRSKPVRDVLTRTEIDQLERVVASERDKLIIRLFGDCGLRLEELSRLQAGDIIRSGRQAHLRVLGKRDRVRDVPLLPHLVRRVDRHIEGRPEDRSSEHIFLALRRGPRGEYEALTVGGIYQVVKDAVERAHITKRVYPHLLRHSWMTEMLRDGMNPVQLSVIAGASMEVIAQHYAHLTKDDAYDAMVRALTNGRR